MTEWGTTFSCMWHACTSADLSDCVCMCTWKSVYVCAIQLLSRMVSQREGEKKAEKHTCTHRHTHCTSKPRKCVYSRSMWQTWRCWTAGRTPGRCAARGSRCWRGWQAQATGPRRWSWAGSRVRGWARPTRRRSPSCRGWRTLRGSPGSPCCCSASCTGTEEKGRGKRVREARREERQREDTGRGAGEKGLGSLEGGRITLGRESCG